MSDGPTRREIMKAVEEIEVQGPDRSGMTISVPKDTHDALRKEAGLDPSSPGYEWDDTRSSTFWDEYMEVRVDGP